MKENLTHRLKENLLGVLGDRHNHQQINAIIVLCHAIAHAFLKKTIIDGSIKQDYLGLGRSDIAYDCIADLFQKDDSGSFIKLQAFFNSLDVGSLSDQEILTHFRRIVSSRVNQGLYRIYQEADPSLGKILRNIKISVSLVKNFDEIERFGEMQIVPIQCELGAHLPSIDVKTLENDLGDYVNGSETIPQLLAKLSLYLREQQLYRRSVSVVTVALAFRSLYSRDMKITETAQPGIDEAMLVTDTTLILTAAFEHVKSQVSHKYLHKKKVPRSLLNDYFAAIEKNISYTILGMNGEDTSLYGALKNRIPTLTPIIYRTDHKNTVEYLARLCKEEAINRLRKSNS